MLGTLRQRITGSAVGRIMAGSVVGQGVLLLASPLLTRMYSPADFSSLALVTAFVGVLSSLVTLSWDRAVILPQSEADSWTVVRLGTYSTLLLSTATGIGCYVFRDGLSKVFGSNIFVEYWWVIPGTTLIVGQFVMLSSWAVRHRRYGQLATRNMLVGLGQAATSIGLGAVGVVPLGLLSSLGTGRLISLPGLMTRPRLADGRSGTRGDLWRLARQYRKFPLITSWSRTLNSLGLQLPMVLLIALFGSFEAGFVALTIRVLASPVGIIVDAVSQYFEGEASARVRSRDAPLLPLVMSICRGLAMVAALPTLVVGFLGPGIFALVFGTQWADAGFYAQFLAAVYFFQFVAVPVSRTLLILERQWVQMIWDMSRLLVTCGLIVLGNVTDAGITVAVVSFAGAQVAWYLALLVLVYSSARRWDREVDRAAVTGSRLPVVPG